VNWHLKIAIERTIVKNIFSQIAFKSHRKMRASSSFAGPLIYVLSFFHGSPAQAQTRATPENLQSAWTIALSGDHRIREAERATAAATDELGAAKDSRLPSVSMQGAYNVLDHAPTGEIDLNLGIAGLPSTLNQQLIGNQFGITSIMVSAPLFTSGQIHHGIAAAASSVKASQYEKDRTELDVKLDVAAAYINVLRAQHAAEVAQSSVVSLRSFAVDVKNLQDEGLIPRNDLLAAQVALADARQREIQASNTLDIARASFNRLLGRPLTDPVLLEEITPDMITEETQALTQRAMKQRPELSTLDGQAEALRQKAASVRAGGLPQLAFSGGNTYLQDELLVHKSIWSVSVALRWEVFDGGTRHRNAQALVERAQAVQERRADADSIIALQVRQAWLDTQETEKRIVVTQESVTQAEENLKVAKDRYLEGVGTNTEVLDAETLRVRTLTNRWSAIYDSVLADMRLHRAVGDL